MMTNVLKWFIVVLTVTISWMVTTAAASSLECHPQGPILPRPRHLTKSPTFQAATKKLTGLLDSAFKGDIKAGFVVANTSISISVVSLDQTVSTIPAWEYHHTALNTDNGTTEVDRDSLYMIASVSKAVSDAIFIRSGIPAGDPITKYIPELASRESRIDWGVVTLGMLAGHLGGIPPNYGFSEYYYLREYFEYLGFPRINETEYPPCGVNTLSEGCTREEFLKGILNLHPVTSPNTQPVYSNIAFTLLIYAVREFTSNSSATFAELLNEYITRPLNMTHTFISGNLPPSGQDLSSQAVIPPVPNNFNATSYKDDAPGGGLVSSLADLSSFVHSIISHSIFGNSPGDIARVREWLLPKSFLGSPNTFLGQPWEIYRPKPEVLFPGKTAEKEAHTVTFVSKDGSAYGYRSRIVMVDEYGVGFVVLVAGDPEALEVIYGALASTMIPAIDEVAREEVTRQEGGYVGGFARLADEENVEVEVKFGMVDWGSTLGLIELRRNGSDLVQGLEDAWTYSLGWFLPGLKNSGVWRLYPAEIYREVEEIIGGRKVSVVKEDWRLWWDVEPTIESDLPGRELVAGDCSSWSVSDWVYYGGEAIDRVVFVKDRDTGAVLGVEFPFLRTGVVEKSKV